MKKYHKLFGVALAILILASVIFIGYRNINKDKEDINTVNVNSHIPSEYSYENVVDKNYAIKIYDGLKEEVINLSVIEEFIKNSNDKKSSDIFLIEYLDKDNIKKVKNLMNLKFNGEEGTLIKYDVSNEKEFKESTRKKFKKIVKSGDNTGANIVILEDELQSPLEGEVIFTYEEGASKEYK